MPLGSPWHGRCNNIKTVNAMNTNAIKNRMRDARGFTILEIMIIAAILTILASIALPNLARARQNAEDARMEKELQSIYTAIVMFETANGRRPNSWDEMRNYIWIPGVESKYELNTGIQ